MWTTGKDFREEREDDGYHREENQSCHFFDKILFCYYNTLIEITRVNLTYSNDSSISDEDMRFRLGNMILAQETIQILINVYFDYYMCQF